jgi:hypothetical protein
VEAEVRRAHVLALSLAAASACHDAAPRCPSPAAPLEVVEAPLLGRELLSDPADRAGRAGAGPLVVVAVGLAAEGDKVGGFVSLPPERCVLLYARGSKGVLDLDLFGFADDGAALATDESASANAGLVLCPPHPDRAYFAARVASGSGLVAIGAHEVDVDRSADAAVAVGARKSGEESGRLESWPGLEAKLATPPPSDRLVVGGRPPVRHRGRCARAPRGAPSASMRVAAWTCFVVPLRRRRHSRRLDRGHRPAA